MSTNNQSVSYELTPAQQAFAHLSIPTQELFHAQLALIKAFEVLNLKSQKHPLYENDPFMKDSFSQSCDNYHLMIISSGNLIMSAIMSESFEKGESNEY